MSRVSFQAALQLAKYLQPFLADIPVLPLQQTYNQDAEAEFPSVVILPGKHEFQPWQLREINTEDDTKLLAHLGDYEGTTEIRVYSLLAPQREAIETVITEAFMQREGAPGVVVLTIPPIRVGGTQWTSNSYAAYEFEDYEWKEEMVFTSSRFSSLTLSSQCQMYSSFNIPDINQLILDLRDENNIEIEKIRVNADGSITPVS